MGKLKKRRRRSRSEIQKIRDHFLGAVLEEGKISLTELVSKYGSEINVQNTASDKNLVKRQLDQLAREGALELRRDGRDLVARAGGNGQPTAAAAPGTSSASATKATSFNRARFNRCDS